MHIVIFMNLSSVLQEHIQDNLFTWFNTDTEEEGREDLIKNLQVVDSTKQQRLVCSLDYSVNIFLLWKEDEAANVRSLWV